MTRHTWFRLDRHDDPAPVDPAPVVDPPADPKPPFDGDFDPARAAKLIENLRAELAGVKAKQGTAAEDARKEVAAQVAKALGQAADDPADPAELVTQIQEWQADAWGAASELNVIRAAAKAGADPERLLDSVAFVNTLDELMDMDPRSTEFRDAIAAKVAAAVAANPGFKAGPSAPRPDPGQGGRPDVAIDYTTASREDFAKEAAKYRLRPRQY
jgi:hypothetical protein